MKISEMNNEQATEALVRIATPVGNICDDEKTVAMFEQFKRFGEETSLQEIGRMIPQITTLLLKSHKEDIYEIVGALTFKTVKQVAGMNFMETVQVIKESYDEVLHNFFI